MTEAVSYISEPPTSGKVLVHTTIGDLDIELFSGQAPLACRNFVQHCLDGYYDGCLFHRVIKGFMAQTGLETAYDKGDKDTPAFGPAPFADEFHSRLKFTRRGMIGMATNGKHANRAQWFVTLGPADFLTRQHTLFGKLTGDTLFNILRFEELDIENATGSSSGKGAHPASTTDSDSKDRPYNPPKILSTEVLMNPFDDLQRRVQAKPLADAEKRPKKKQKKNLALLSFGEEEAMEEAAVASATAAAPRGGTSSHDLVENDARLSKKTLAEEEEEGAAGATGADQERISQARQSVREKLQQSKASASGKSTGGGGGGAGAAVVDEEYMDENQYDAHMRRKLLQAKGIAPVTSARLPDAPPTDKDGDTSMGDGGAPPPVVVDRSVALSEIDRLKAEMGLGVQARSTAKGAQAVKGASASDAGQDALLSPLEQRRARFKTRKENAQLSQRESDTLDKLQRFKQKVTSAGKVEARSRDTVPKTSDVEIPPVPLIQDEDDDVGAFLGHQVKFTRRPQDFDPMARDVENQSFAVVDPRGIEGARELKGPLAAAGGGGGRGRDVKHAGARKGAVGLQGGFAGMHGVLKPSTLGGASKSEAEIDAEEENARVVERLLKESMEGGAGDGASKRKRSRSRSTSPTRAGL